MRRVVSILVLGSLGIGLVGPLAGCAAPDEVRGGTRGEAQTEVRAEAEPSAVQRVGLTEWDIVTEQRPLLPGSVELRVTNTGSTPHDLVLDVEGVVIATPILAAGEQHVLRFEAPTGQRLVAWCTVTGHRAQGMQTEFVVADR